MHANIDTFFVLVLDFFGGKIGRGGGRFVWIRFLCMFLSCVRISQLTTGGLSEMIWVSFSLIKGLGFEFKWWEYNSLKSRVI